MEILPERGVDQVRIGDRRADVEARVGQPEHEGQSRRAVYRTAPTIVVDYTRDDTVAVVQVACSATSGGPEVHLDGVQLTSRFLDDVVADLEAVGLEWTPSDVGADFRAGFSLFSMGSLDPAVLDPRAADDAPYRPVVEGVTIAPYEDLVGPGGPTEPAAPLAEPAPGEAWAALLAVPPVPVRTLDRSHVPSGPGVHLWRRDGEAVYVDMATSLRGATWGTHLSPSVSLTSSPLRRAVCELLFGIPTTTTGNPGRQEVTREQATAVREWLLDCDLSWQVVASPVRPGDLVESLLREFVPHLNRG